MDDLNGKWQQGNAEEQHGGAAGGEEVNGQEGNGKSVADYRFDPATVGASPGKKKGKKKAKQKAAKEATAEDLERAQKLCASAIEHHAQAGQALQSAFEHYRKAGQELNAAKKLVEHGGWERWLEENWCDKAGRSKETAKVYMRIAKPKNWAKLEPLVDAGLIATLQHAREFLSKERGHDGPQEVGDGPTWNPEQYEGKHHSQVAVKLSRQGLKHELAKWVDKLPEEIVIYLYPARLLDGGAIKTWCERLVKEASPPAEEFTAKYLPLTRRMDRLNPGPELDECEQELDALLAGTPDGLRGRAV